MPKINKKDLYLNPEPHARYASDLISRFVMALEKSKVPIDIEKICGPDLWKEICHAIGWDIDWDKINEDRLGEDL